MDFDDISLDEFDAQRRDWIRLGSTSAEGICQLASRYRNNRDDCLLRSMHCGSFNFSWRLHWDDGGDDWLIRFPLPGKSMVLDEKVYREAIVMQYVEKNTSIPVPHVIAHGAGHENPTGLGPFIIMTWIDGKPISEVLRKEGTDPKDKIINPDADEQTLRTLYGQMAEILLELWGLDFDRIGSLGQPESESSNKPYIDGRPLTIEFNELMRTCGMKESIFPSRVYHSSIDYITSLLDQQSLHLEQQRNSIYDSNDYRQKYTCRHLMKAIALNFIDRDDNYGPFKLFCDDLCPGNVLVDDSLRLVGVIDWEFCYAAPAQFAGSIPWWLLLQRPHTIISYQGPDAFFDAYLPKAELFLQVLQQKEEERDTSPSDNRLSYRMRQSIHNKTAWFTLACRKVASVDLIYWDMLDGFCWGSDQSVDERVHHFTTSIEMHKNREDFVRRKIDELQKYYSELGVDKQVEYEEEEEYGQQSRLESGDSCLSYKTPLFLTGAVGILSTTIAVGCFVRWFRR
ncbi:uncharacterized protein PFLUO_LOCUS3151 [Penicillium psychrofluorescens]|uniref:uncharacterized protein n=1 Tax=Penicillium psychrofluorescens TaxID=3158075 RepID=UPI003CCDB744